MANVAVVYHSGYGHTKVVAESVVRGAEAAGARVTLIPVAEWQEHAQALEAADAIVFGSPTYMGDVSGPMKTFMDETSKLWFTQSWKDKLAAGFTNSLGLSGDKFNTLVSLFTFAMQHGMIWIGLGLLPGERDGKKVNRVTAYSGLMTQSDNAPAEETPPADDHFTAELFGERVALAAARWVSGKA
jgi:NAD(P)H dehydrogenase (quinone)